MSMQWYYADRDQQQQGPVDAAWLQGAYGRGEVQAATLVWREGLANWVPLAQVASEVGIALPHTAIPVPPRGPRVPAAAARSGGFPVALVVVIVLGGLVVFLGILAAIAIPAYQDYTVRAKVANALAQASPVKLAVVEHWFSHQTCPTNADEGFAAPESYDDGQLLRAIHIGDASDGDGGCEISLEFSGVQAYQNNVLTMRFNDGNDWSYSTDLPHTALPMSIRAGLEH